MIYRKAQPTAGPERLKPVYQPTGENLRQARLATEISKLDDFIRMAEALLKHSLSKSSKASDTEDEKAADGYGAEAEREGLPVRKLTAEELVRKSRTIHKAPAPVRQRGLEHFPLKAPR